MGRSPVPPAGPRRGGPHELEEDAAVALVEAVEGLVEEDKFWPGNDGAGKQNALFLSAGEIAEAAPGASQHVNAV